MRTGGRGRRRRAAALALTGALLGLPALTACASSADPVDSIQRLGRRAAEEMGPGASASPSPFPSPFPGERERVGRAAVEGKPVERAAVRTADREGRRCLRARELRAEGREEPRTEVEARGSRGPRAEARGPRAEAPESRTTAPPVTPRSDELALRLTEC